MNSNTRDIQLKCMEILEIVDAICREYGISYSLCGGSVVGAHLYGKCLPWDDDIDLMMTREHYNRFLEVAPAKLPEGFSIHSFQLGADFASTFTKLMNDNTTVVQHDGSVSGVFLDITVYDKVPFGWRGKLDELLWKISQVVMIGKLSGSSLKIKLRNLLLSTVLRSKRAYLQFFRRVVQLLARAKEYSYCELFGAYCNTKRYAPEIFENYTRIAFEGKEYMIVRDYVAYLQCRYERTDFREPKEKQVAPHYQYVDLNLPYRQFLAGKGEVHNDQ